MTELWRLSVEELSTGLRRGDLRGVEVVNAFLAHARAVHAELACFVHLDEAAVDVAVARAGDAARGPLFCVPYAYKDVFAYGGRPPSLGVRNLRLTVRARSAEVLDRLDRAGAVPLGTLNLDPIAYAATGLNPELGDTRNPWSPEHIAGGSSGGAAAAVAAGAVPFAVGTDAGGSVRIPAAFCGVTALKPTHGALPTRGAVPLTYSQDTVGILARSARDVALVVEHVADVPVHAAVPARLAQPRPLAGVRVGIDRSYAEERASSEVVQALEDALRALGQLGAAVVEIDLSGLARFDAAATVLTWAEALAVHERELAAAPAAYPPVVRGRLELAPAAHGADHVNALRLRGRALSDLLAGPLVAADVIVAPTTARAAPTIASAAADATEVSLEQLRLNRPYNFSGVPSVALPMGFDPDGLPLGFQIAGRPWAETTLLTCAAAYQAVTDWHLRRPPTISA